MSPVPSPAGVECAYDVDQLLRSEDVARSGAWDWLARIGIVAVFFAAVAPTLFWLQFFHAEENVVIAQALEMRRTGNWLIPTLQGRPRTIKPPLAVWITALVIRDNTLRHLNSNDAVIRASAYRRLGFETRWPTALATGFMLVAVFELGRAIGGRSLGIVSACVCGASWFMLVRQGSRTTVDLHLALWVTATNAFLAWGFFRGRWWPACIGAGVALGLATMSKGPAVPLLQSVVPVLAYAGWRRFAVNRTPLRHRPPVPAIVVGALLMLAIGLSWYVVAYFRVPNIAPVWWAELTRHGANDLRDPWPQYLRAMRLMFPWLTWLIIALIAGVVLIVRKRDEPWMIAFFMAMLPLIVMQCFNERRERYMIPLVAPLAVISAHALLSHLGPRADTWGRIALIAHWIALGALAIGLPIAGGGLWKELRTVSGEPWFSAGLVGNGMAAMTIVLIVGIFRTGYTKPAMLVACTVTVMLVAQGMYVWGFSRDRSGTRDQRTFAEFIWQNYPTAPLYSTYGGDKPGIVFTSGVDLAIYTNRDVTPMIDLSPLKPIDRPIVALAESRTREPIPEPPPGWQEVQRIEKDNGDVIKLFVLPAAGAR